MRYSMSSFRWLVCLLLIVALVACGGGDDEGDDNSAAGQNASGQEDDDTSSAQLELTALAGDDRDVITDTRVRLDGSDSRVEGDRQIAYRWRLVSRPEASEASLDAADSARPTFIADVAGRYTAELRVRSGEASDTDRVTVTARDDNTQPQAAIEVDRAVETGMAVTLDGSGSQDADGDALSYRWRFVSRPTGSDAELADAQAATPSFTPNTPGDYVVRLTVTDPDGARDSAQTTITAASGNSAPIAAAGEDVSVRAGNTVSLDGSDSRDADDDTLNYAWRIVSQPTGSAASLANPNSARPSLTTDLAGDYVLELTVGDGQARDTDRVVVTAGSALLFRIDQSDIADDDSNFREAPNQAVIRYRITDSQGQGLPDGLLLRRLSLEAIGQSYTIRDVQTALVESSNETRPRLVFDGLTSGAIIQAGETQRFRNRVRDVSQAGTYRFDARFEVAETDESYRVRYILTVD